MSQNSKQKGKTCERLISNELSKWSSKPFKVVPASGALRWGGASFVYGDILPPQECWCIFETKHYKNVSTDAVLNQGPNSLTIYWWNEQIVKDVKRARTDLKKNIHGILVWKQNQGIPRMVLSLPLFEMFPVHINLRHLRIYYPPMKPLVIVLLKDFCLNVSYSEFVYALKHLDSRSYIS
jgi:hypothetical protein